MKTTRHLLTALLCSAALARGEVQVTAERLDNDDAAAGFKFPRIPSPIRGDAAAKATFTLLDGARDPNRGGGVGLGLAITADVARAHGGALRLGDSERLGGLKADLILARQGRMP